jgi:type IV secretion system protein VirB9
LFVNVFPLTTLAIREPRSTSVDSRIKVMTYSPDDVHRYTGYYGYQANIEFAEGESVDSISMGDTTAWQIIPAGRRIFLKPMEDNSTTNMTIITNMHDYHFDLFSKKLDDKYLKDLVYVLRFYYPEVTESETIQANQNNQEIQTNCNIKSNDDDE